MKKKLFLFGFCFFFLSVSQDADASIFVANYDRIKNEMNQVSAEKTAKMLGADVQLILNYVQKEQLTDEDKNTLFQVCIPESESGQYVLSSLEKAECLAKIQKTWEDERSFIRDEVIQTEKTFAYSKFYDGQLDHNEDLDITADVHMLFRQFAGEETPPSDIPVTNMGNQHLFSLADNDYRLPDDGSLPFASSGGCEKGQASLYGGIVCLPEFCNDFMCIKVRAVPGRKGSSSSICDRRSSEASMKNIICAMEDVSNILKESDQLTPTRNSNRAHLFNQLFDSLMNMKTNLSIKPKTPPIFSTESDREKSTPEGEKMAAEFRKELDRVRREEFDACQQGEKCTNEHVLTSFFFDCGLFGSRGTFGPLYQSAKKCADEKLELMKRKQEEARIARQKMIRDVKQEFYEEMPENMNELWESIGTFEDAILSINLCKIQQAKYRCGTEKMDCSLKDYGL